MARKKSLKNEIRFHLGMSQEWFAMWIGITRSLLAMVEAKKRSLPYKAWSKKLNIDSS